FTICAPMFSNLSESSISLATVTPSLVMRGAPNDLSRTTLRPFGPRVTFTASARMLTPRSIRSRASVLNLTSLAAMSLAPGCLWGCGSESVSGDDAEDVAFLHDQHFGAVDGHFRARPLAEEDPVAFLDRRCDQLARVLARAFAHGDDFAFGGFLFRAVGDDQTALGLLFAFHTLDQNAVMKRFECH